MVVVRQQLVTCRKQPAIRKTQGRGGLRCCCVVERLVLGLVTVRVERRRAALARFLTGEFQCL